MAQLDPSIILQAGRTSQPFDLFGSMNQGQQFGMNRMNMQQHQMQLQDAQRKQAKMEAVSKIMGKYANPQTGQINYEGALSELAQTGFGDVAHELGQNLMKSQAENDYKTAQADRERAQKVKDEIEAKEKLFGVADRQQQFLGMLGGGLRKTLMESGPQVAKSVFDLGMQQYRSAGGDMTGIPTDFTPDAISYLENLGVGAEKRGEWGAKEAEGKALDKRHQETLNVTKRGQDLVSSRSGEANRVAAQGNVIKGETDIRKEFADLPEVKNYKSAYPAFAAVEKASKGNTPQSDINLIYGIAKLYDPIGVVREGEYNTIANSQAIPEKIKGWAKMLLGGGRLTAETKSQLMAEARDRISTYEGEYRNAQAAYTGIAQQRGLSPESIFTPIGDVGQRGETKQPKFTPKFTPKRAIPADVQSKMDRAKANGASGAEIEAALKKMGY